MANLKRYFEDGAAYSVTTATKGRKPLFRDHKLSRILLVTIEYYKTVFDYMVLGYCLMPDHLHLVLRPSVRFNLPFLMQMIKGSFARKVNRLNDVQGPVWQRRYYDQVILGQRHLINQLNYIHHNPVEAGLVSSPNDYSLSSFNQYHNIQSLGESILSIDHFEVGHP